MAYRNVEITITIIGQQLKKKGSSWKEGNSLREEVKSKVMKIKVANILG